ncbi:MAG: DUF1540 domain-containing protein [Eubacteriales bacterium]|nr:DUF1540 domain-containing protein [Eubacteriales bacterium]
MDSNVNRSIHCTVKNCVHNNKEQNYCKLDSIKVGTHESNPTEKQCVDCESFVLNNRGCSSCS